MPRRRRPRRRQAEAARRPLQPRRRRPRRRRRTARGASAAAAGRALMEAADGGAPRRRRRYGGCGRGAPPRRDELAEAKKLRAEARLCPLSCRRRHRRARHAVRAGGARTAAAAAASRARDLRQLRHALCVAATGDCPNCGDRAANGGHADGGRLGRFSDASGDGGGGGGGGGAPPPPSPPKPPPSSLPDGWAEAVDDEGEVPATTRTPERRRRDRPEAERVAAVGRWLLLVLV